MNEIVVVNKHRDQFDVYIGRGSIWGNPFPLARDHTDADRARVIQHYEDYLLSRPELMARLPELLGKRLACFCAPKPCHGDVLKKHGEAGHRAEPDYSHVVLVTGSRTWDDEQAMRSAFNDLWRAWGPANVTRPLLLSGQCTQGADAMAEQLWQSAGLEVRTFPADWSLHGRGAGFRRNREMVEYAVSLRDAGATVVCAAFLDLCGRNGCAHQRQEQLMPHTPGHFSHGTIHCRQQATDACLDVVDVIHSALPSF